MKPIIFAFAAIGLVLSGPLRASDLSPPAGKFMFALSISDNRPPEVSVATITKTPDAQYVMEYLDRWRNKWSIPIKFRTFQKRDGSKVVTFDGYFEQKDGGASGVFSMRYLGCVMPDGSMEGSLIRITTPDYQSSESEQASIQKFRMRALKDDEQGAPSDGDKPSN